MENRPALEELPREMHRQLYRFVMQLRFVIAPLPVIVGGFVIIADPTLWRRVTLLSTLLVATLLIALHHHRVRSKKPPSLQVVLSLVTVLQLSVFFATGGIVSPVLLAILLVCFVASTVLTRKASGAIVVLQVLSLVTASTLEYLQPFGSLVPAPFKTVAHAGPSPALLLIFTGIASVFFFVTRGVGHRIRQAFADMIERTLAAREQSLQLHRERLADLTLLSAEIAHELKNPLASIKGLAALMARRSEGSEPEPLKVLRREVDRMQGTLEEFLNFSRPLVPLNLRPLDLRRVVGEVVGMHEGLSSIRGIDIEVTAGPPAEVSGDPRKVQQILVNLLQNALEASDTNGRVHIQLAVDEEQVTVVIADEGMGLDPALADRIYEAGVTSKVEGSGLGLNVARGLARQHGGDVIVRPRSPRGCIATMRLPRRPALETQSPRISAFDVGSRDARHRDGAFERNDTGMEP